MGKPKALYYDVLKYEEENIALLEEHFELIRLDTPDDDSPEVLQNVEVLFAPLGYDCGQAKMNACPRLKVIASNTTGAPHIDLDYAREKGIEVAYLGPETEFLATITSTAEHAWGLMLALMRRTPWAFDDVKAGHWYRFRWAGPKKLSRMTLGIIGLGRLGKMVAGYGRAFGMEVLYYDPYVDASSAPDVTKVEDLAQLVSRCDVVSIHCHVTPETTGMMDKGIFAAFKPGAYLVNTARMAVVDREAMLDALRSGRLAGVALDVLGEEYDRDFGKSTTGNPLVAYAREHDNLLITPHIAGSTLDSWFETRRHTIELAIRRFPR